MGLTAPAVERGNEELIFIGFAHGLCGLGNYGFFLAAERRQKLGVWLKDDEFSVMCLGYSFGVLLEREREREREMDWRNEPSVSSMGFYHGY